MVGYVLMIALGTYLYEESRHGKVDGMVGYMGFSLATFTLVSQTPMMVMLTLTMITLAHRFDY